MMTNGEAPDRLSIRLRKDDSDFVGLFDKLRSVAKKNHRTVNQEVNVAIHEHVQRELSRNKETA